jgi:hypothetical protein
MHPGLSQTQEEEMTQLSANGGHWRPSGTMVYRLPKFTYDKPFKPGDEIHWKLGDIKLRTDGRWNWWRYKSPYFPEWREGQGISLTKMGASYAVHEGWLPQETSQYHLADVYEYVHHDEVLGRVIDTHTGVWTWVRHRSKLHPEWKPGKGTSGSRRLAHQNLMEGWE